MKASLFKEVFEECTVSHTNTVCVVPTRPKRRVGLTEQVLSSHLLRENDYLGAYLDFGGIIQMQRIPIETSNFKVVYNWGPSIDTPFAAFITYLDSLIRECESQNKPGVLFISDSSNQVRNPYLFPEQFPKAYKHYIDLRVERCRKFGVVLVIFKDKETN